ncbi:hypothetical protein, partial [Soonwooa purpurea]
MGLKKALQVTLYWQNAGGSAKLKSRKNNTLMLFNSAIFCKLVVLKKHSLRLVFLEFFVLRKPALRQYFFRYVQFSQNHAMKVNTEDLVKICDNYLSDKI